MRSTDSPCRFFVLNSELRKELDTYQFEWWAVDLVGARPARDRKKGADSGATPSFVGYIYFIDDNSGAAKKVVVQVKSPSADGWA